MFPDYTTDSYAEAVPAAVYLGNDTDTTAAITGGLAGLYYGKENIPAKWIKSLARVEDIQKSGEELDLKFKQHP